jgi:hypothetical protein
MLCSSNQLQSHTFLSFIFYFLAWGIIISSVYTYSMSIVNTTDTPRPPGAGRRGLSWSDTLLSL